MDNKNNGLANKDKGKGKEVDREEDREMTSGYAGTTWTRIARNRNEWRNMRRATSYSG